MSRLAQALVVLGPFLVAAGTLTVRWRRGKTPGPALLVGLAFLAVGALFWFALAGDTEVDMPWTWVLGVVLGVIAIAAVLSAQRAAQTLLVCAVAFPVAAVLFMAALYLFGSGVDDGAGGQEPFLTMAGVSLMGSLASFTGPALVTWAVLRAAEHPWRNRRPGWYPDPDDPHLLRRWDGRAWTDETAKPPPPTAEVAMRGPTV